ncbi:MAG: hypothetical protein LBE64_08300 [Acinetobacter pittii]|jgi:hypothetical protein|nr:hypothetical protein N7497_009927 [Penicillium chrysogenum]MBZ6431103.1 hypothetical protein [Acinetobacter pittii]
MADVNTTNSNARIGAGAPSDDNWYEYIDAVQTGGTQADKLPVIGSFVLYKLEPSLKNKEDFNTWYDRVYRILRGYRLHKLIDKNVERPYIDAPDAENWFTLSIQVTAWLSYCIEPEIVKDINSTGQRVELADDFMHQLKLYMRGEGHDALSAAMMKLFNTKRMEFTTAGEFIDGVKQRFKAANNLKSKLSPYTAIVIVTSQLQEIPELRSAIDIRNNEMKKVKDPANEISLYEYFRYCADMHDKIRELGIDGGGL